MKYTFKDYEEFAYINSERGYGDPRLVEVTHSYDGVRCISVINPWMDETGRFSLTLEKMIETWGMDLIIEFCRKAHKQMKKEHWTKDKN